MRQRSFAIPFLAVAVAACGPGNAASGLAKAPEYAPKDQAKCSVKASQTRPLIVEWPSADRAGLESQSKKGVVVVKYAGCEMEVLRRCKAPGAYGYTGITHKRDKVTMRDVDDLYSKLPLGAVSLEAKLRRAGELNVDMTIVGTYDSDRTDVKLEELQGDCAGATHIVTSLTVGAFDFYAGADADVGAGANIGGAGGGASSTSKRETLNQDGDLAACAKPPTTDKGPPDGCGALLRLEVATIGEGKATNVAAPSPQVASTAGPSSQPPTPGPKCVAGMVRLAAGSFTTGERGDAASVGGFCIDATEVTVDAYAACVASKRCKAPAPPEKLPDGTITKGSVTYTSAGKGNHPVNLVGWDDANTYCQAQGKRLPTEEEWEWAARGGAEGRVFPWGDAPPGAQLCWNGAPGRTTSSMSCAVGSFPSGDAPGGIHDMAGNVMEWTSTQTDIKGKPCGVNSSCPSETGRVVRGSTWWQDAAKAQATTRQVVGPMAMHVYIGFRCAR